MTKYAPMIVLSGCLWMGGCPAEGSPYEEPNSTGVEPTTGDTTSPGSANDSGSTTDAMVSTGSTGGAMDSTGVGSTDSDAGNSSSPPSDSSGGGPLCASCAEALSGEAEVFELCGTDIGSGLCSQDTPCQRHRVLRNCWCMACAAECGDACPAMGHTEQMPKMAVDATCQACRDTASAGACMAEFTACEMDTGR